MKNPFFSIGLTTYNRKDLLIQTLNSLQAQTFTDFEIIIGNDYTEEILTSESLGIRDPRIRIINNRKNIGERENMNSLLGEARGRYFTWQFDDLLDAGEVRFPPRRLYFVFIYLRDRALSVWNYGQGRSAIALGAGLSPEISFGRPEGAWMLWIIQH
jgi:glycosyltransferase involved in cell wall biosynthesis